MAWFSVIYFFLIGLFLVVFSFSRLRAVYRFVKMVMKIPGPSWWELATVHSKYLLSDDTISYMCKICKDYAYKPWGLFTMTLDFIVVVSDPDTIGEVFKNPYLTDKSEIIYGGLANYLPKGSLVLNGERWKWHRKTVSPAFRKRNMDMRIDVINEGAEEMVRELRSKADGPSFDVTDIIDMGTVDLSLRFIASGVPIVPSSRIFYEAVEEGMMLAQSKVLNPYMHWFRLRFDKTTVENDRSARNMIKNSGPIFKEAKIAAKNRMYNRTDSQPLDIVECLSSVTMVPGMEVDDEELLEEALTIAVGGMETTRTGLKMVLCLLALYPEVQQRVYEELESIFGDDDRRPCPQDIQRMRYMDAVIKETLRMYPPIPLIGRKVSRTTRIGGMSIPRGACVIMNLMGLHRHPDLYEDPSSFIPERFLKEGREKHPYSYLPFGSGPRTCVGYAQSIMTLKICIAAIMRNFCIIPGEKIKSMDDLKIKMSVTITFREPMIKLISRKKEISV